MRGHLLQPVKILALKTYNTDGINVAKFALAHEQSGAGYFDRIVRCPLPPADLLQYPSGLFAAAAAEFGHGDGRVQAVHDLTRVALQQTFIGSGESVLGQMADYLEERRAHVVIEVLGGEFLLSRPRESLTHIGGEFASDTAKRVKVKRVSVNGVGVIRVKQHSESPSSVSSTISG
jgi:hypothetical protein